MLVAVRMRTVTADVAVIMDMPARSMTVGMGAARTVRRSDGVRTRMRVSLLTAFVRMTYPGADKSHRCHDECQQDPHDRRIQSPSFHATMIIWK